MLKMIITKSHDFPHHLTFLPENDRYAVLSFLFQGKKVIFRADFPELTTEESKFFDNEHFYINQEGALYFKHSKDFESDKRNYYIKIDATAHRLSSTGGTPTTRKGAIFRVVLRDIYEPKPPAFLNLPTQHSVDEGDFRKQN